MRKGLTFLPSLALATLIALPTLAAEEPNADTVVARVNGEEITIGNMIIAYETLPQKYQNLPKNLLFDGILDQLIQQNVLSQSHGPEVSKRITLSLQNERRQLLAGDVMKKIIAEDVTDADIQAAYDTQYANADGGMEYNASHILVETEEEAKAIAEELRGGADFAEMAKAKSTGPSGPSGGKLGWFSKGQMVPEFEAAVTSMTKGEISDPVKTQFGWHVIKLNDSRKKAAPTLDEVRDTIASDLQRAAIEARIAKLTEAATVERPEIQGLDPEILGKPEILDN